MALNDIEYHVAIDDYNLKENVPDMLDCYENEKDRELAYPHGPLRETLARTHEYNPKRIKRERRPFKQHLIDVNLSLYATIVIVFVMLVMNVAFTATNIPKNPQCRFSDINIYKEDDNANGNFCIPTDKENTIFYCCKSNFHWCLTPECESKMMTHDDDAFSVANLAVSCMCLIVLVFILFNFINRIFTFRKTFREMFRR
jgi:hypothetical protein